MFQETELNRADLKMRLFFQRGVEIANQGLEQMGLTPQTDSPYFYQEFSVVIGGKDFRLIHGNRRGQFTSGQTFWTTRERLIVMFTPQPEDNLRVIKSSKGELPIFEVYVQDDEHHGVLRFDSKHIERGNWFSRVEDSFKQLQVPPEACLVTVDFVGENRGADRILGNLNSRFKATPTSITPIEPDKWGEILRGQVR